jgi:hypothetical protein
LRALCGFDNLFFGSVSLPDAQCALGGLEMTTDDTLEGLRSYYHQEQLAGPIAELIEATAVVADLVAAMRDDLGTLDLAFDRQERAAEALMSAYQQAMADFIVDSTASFEHGRAQVRDSLSNPGHKDNQNRRHSDGGS